MGFIDTINPKKIQQDTKHAELKMAYICGLYRDTKGYKKHFYELELPELKSSLATIQHTANKIISGMDRYLKEDLTYSTEGNKNYLAEF